MKMYKKRVKERDRILKQFQKMGEAKGMLIEGGDVLIMISHSAVNAFKLERNNGLPSGVFLMNNDSWS